MPSETFSAEPNAVLDTNVALAIYSWHDVLDEAEPILRRDPTADLMHPDIQFRLQRARAAFYLTLFLDAGGWMTIAPLHELDRTLRRYAPPEGGEGSVKTNFVKMVVHFVNDKLLPAWQSGSNPQADETISSTDVDRLCIDWAAHHGVPLISWEGWGKKGFDPTAFIPSEALKRGVDHVSPEQLLNRERFVGHEEALRFFAGWKEHAPEFIAENPSAAETMNHFYHYYHRLAANDWVTPSRGG